MQQGESHCLAYDVDVHAQGTADLGVLGVGGDRNAGEDGMFVPERCKKVVDADVDDHTAAAAGHSLVGNYRSQQISGIVNKRTSGFQDEQRQVLGSDFRTEQSPGDGFGIVVKGRTGIASRKVSPFQGIAGGKSAAHIDILDLVVVFPVGAHSQVGKFGGSHRIGGSTHDIGSDVGMDPYKFHLFRVHDPVDGIPRLAVLVIEAEPFPVRVNARIHIDPDGYLGFYRYLLQ